MKAVYLITFLNINANHRIFENVTGVMAIIIEYSHWGHPIIVIPSTNDSNTKPADELNI